MKFFTRRKRGSILILTVSVFTILAFSVGSFLCYVRFMGRINQRQRERSRAFYVAESGVHQVIHWFNHPTDYTNNPETFAKLETTQSYYDNNGISKYTTTINIPTDMLPIFRDERGSMIGKVVEITILPPSNTDPIPSLCRVRSVGETYTAYSDQLLTVRRTVEMFLDADRAGKIDCPAGIISKMAAEWGGQANIHWGEAWAKHNASLPPLGQVPKVNEDPWFKLKTEAFILMGNSNYADGTVNGDTTPLPDSAPNYYQPWLLSNANYTNLYQHQVLEFPQFDYQAFKDLAMKRGKYYGSDIDGNI